MSVIVDEGYIFNVAVDGTHRNRGIGSALVETLVTYAKKNNLCFHYETFMMKFRNIVNIMFYYIYMSKTACH